MITSSIQAVARPTASASADARTAERPAKTGASADAPEAERPTNTGASADAPAAERPTNTGASADTRESASAAATNANAPVPSARSAEKLAYERNKLHKRLLRLTGKAIADFAMIEDGDRVMVCLSGGKDSYGLLDLLLTLRARAPIAFEIVAVNLDQKQPGFPEHVLPDYLRKLGVPFHIENQDTYSTVTRVVPEGRTMCSLCSRLRRGILYRVADELGATKIALGHHRDDILETFFLNMFFGGQLKAMPPKLVSDNGRHIVVRPLAYVEEGDLEAYAQWREFPIIPCNLCGSQENLKRREIKQLMRDWEKRFPGRVENIFAALGRVTPSHLMDRERFDFAGLRTSDEPVADGDIAFDVNPHFDRTGPPLNRPAGSAN